MLMKTKGTDLLNDSKLELFNKSVPFVALVHAVFAMAHFVEFRAYKRTAVRFIFPTLGFAFGRLRQAVSGQKQTSG